MMIGLSNGEAIRNDIVLPKGTPALRNPTVIGMVEQAQNGVSAPNPAATESGCQTETVCQAKNDTGLQARLPCKSGILSFIFTDAETDSGIHIL